MHAPRAIVEPDSAACGVACHALVEAPLADIPALRDRAVPPGCGPLPPRFLRHSDEQTVVAMRAVLEAIASAADAGRSSAEYGVVAASCQPGRIAAAHSLTMLRAGGPVTVSPHIVPQCSLHSIAGAVSVALGMHGPNIGASGGAEALTEGLLASLTLLHAGTAPGIWFIATAWDGEPVLDAEGRPVDRTFDSPICVAVAVALTAATSAVASRLVLGVSTGVAASRPPRLARAPANDIRRFARALTAVASKPDAAACWSHALPGVGELRLFPTAAATSHREAA